jgi:hypothetical protein
MIFKKFKTVFDQLPPMDIGGKIYNPVFRFGTEDDLVKYLSVTRKSGARYYPLIWLETPQEEAGEISVNFTIATLNIRTDMGNFDRLKYTFEPTLEPLLTNMITAIKGSRAFKFSPGDWDKNYRGTKIFNYTVTPDIWDAITITWSLSYTRECEVKLPINF